MEKSFLPADERSKNNELSLSLIHISLGDVLTYDYIPDGRDVEPTDHVFFDGYRRADGKVGIRNEIWIIPTVGCVNSIAKALEAQAGKLAGGTVEDVIAFPHPYGCLLYTSRCV